MIDSALIERLRGIGLAPQTLQQLSLELPEDAPGHWMRVTEVQREGITLHDGEREWPARMLPVLRHELAADDDALAVGDWVRAERNALGEWWVGWRAAPRNQIARRQHDGREKATRAVIVSNVDTALLVMGLDHDFNLRRLERYLALVRLSAVDAVVVLTKADQCAEVASRLAQVRQLLPPAVVAVAVNALSDEPQALLAPWLASGQTLVVLGSSGVGKSTLTNALAGALLQRTGASREDDGRGRHTTTTRSLHRLPGGACLIDTPGLRTLRLDGDSGSLATVFEDIAGLALTCRFRDCRHGNEPGCAVREGVAPERLRSFHKLQREARRDTLSALERKDQVSQWKARGREARVRLKAKRG